MGTGQTAGFSRQELRSPDCGPPFTPLTGQNRGFWRNSARLTPSRSRRVKSDQVGACLEFPLGIRAPNGAQRPELKGALAARSCKRGSSGGAIEGAEGAPTRLSWCPLSPRPVRRAPCSTKRPPPAPLARWRTGEGIRAPNGAQRPELKGALAARSCKRGSSGGAIEGAEGAPTRLSWCPLSPRPVRRAPCSTKRPPPAPLARWRTGEGIRAIMAPKEAALAEVLGAPSEAPKGLQRAERGARIEGRSPATGARLPTLGPWRHSSRREGGRPRFARAIT